MDFIEVNNGVARNVLPGQWTVVLHNDQREVSLEPIEVKASGNPVWTITPQWQPVPQRQRP